MHAHMPQRTCVSAACICTKARIKWQHMTTARGEHCQARVMRIHPLVIRRQSSLHSHPFSITAIALVRSFWPWEIEPTRRSVSETITKRTFMQVESGLNGASKPGIPQCYVVVSFPWVHICTLAKDGSYAFSPYSGNLAKHPT